MDHKEAQEMLFRAGFTYTEITRLGKVRKRFSRKDGVDQPTLDRRRLEFARWLFQQGKMTDHVA